MITTLTNVAVQDQTVTTNIVYFSNVMEGVDGATSFGYNLEKTSLKVEDNQELQYIHNHTFDIRALDPSTADRDTLQVMVDNQREVKIIGQGVDGFFIMDEGVQLNYNQQFDEVVTMPLLATVKSTSGYEGTAPNKKYKVYAGDNLLALYKVNSGDSEFLNGFGTSAGVTGTQSGISQTATRASGTTSVLISKNYFFPFVGVEVTASLNVSAANAGYRISLGAYSDTASTLEGIADLDTSGTGLKSVTLTTPADTKYLRLLIRPGSTVSDAVTFDSPMIALNGKTQFTL